MAIVLMVIRRENLYVAFGKWQSGQVYQVSMKDTSRYLSGSELRIHRCRQRSAPYHFNTWLTAP